MQLLEVGTYLYQLGLQLGLAQASYTVNKL